ncbi:MAG: anion permease, partial [Thermoplasmata archaeon]|nr:anion permease [Thermoplasmata archaeon]
PIVVPMAILLGAGGNESDYAFIVTMATALASGLAFITVFGTPPNTIVHASGLVTSRDFMNAGTVLWIVSVLIMLFVVNTYWKTIL